MKKTSTILLLCSTLAFVACSDSSKNTTDKPIIKEEKAKQSVGVTPTIAKEVKPLVEQKHNYTITEIYEAMCIQCHSSDGSGNTEKLTPSMKELSQLEMKDALLEVEKDQGHIIMEHNRGEILKMGMEYSAQDMSEYMFKRFNK